MKQQDDYFELLFELSPDVIYSISSADATLLRINPAFGHITGFPVKDWIGQPFTDLVHPEDLPLAQERFHRHLIGGSTDEPFRLRIRHASGKYLIGEFSSVSLKREGKVEEIIGIARDITERIETGKKIERANELLQDLMRQSHSG